MSLYEPDSPNPEFLLCRHCGTNNPGANSVCFQCGTPLRTGTTAAESTPPGLPRTDSASNPEVRQLDLQLPTAAPAAQPVGPPPTVAQPPAYPSPPQVPSPPQPPAAYTPSPGHAAVQFPEPVGARTATPGWQTPPSSAIPNQFGARAGAPLPQFGSLSHMAGGLAQAMTCGVCGSQIFPGQQKCLRCRTVPGTLVDPNDPTASTSIPFGPPVPLNYIFRAGAVTSAEDTGDRVGGWNWGAALMPTVWAARHRIGWLAGVSFLLTALLISLFLLRAALHRTPDASGTLTGFLISCALLFGIPRSLFTALRGNTLALRSGLYPNRESLRKAQRSFTVWAIIGTTVLALLLGVAAAMLGAR